MQVTTTNQGLAVQQNSHPLEKPKAKDVEKNNLFQVVAASVAKSFADTGYKEISEEDRSYLVNELTNNIRRDHTLSSIRLEEIPVAFQRGVRKSYGDYFGLSLITFEGFIRSYLESDARKDLIKSLPQNEQKSEPDDLTKYQIAKSNALHALGLKKEGKDMDLYSLPVYSLLDGLKLINFSRDEKLEFLNDARRVLADETERQLATADDSIKRIEIRKTLDAIVEGNETDLVIVRAKKLALHAYFESLILEEVDLDELIESRKDLFLKGLQNG